MQSPQPHFHIIKQVFPHGILCWSKSGYPVFAMRLGPLKNEFSRLAAAGVGNDELVSHVAFVYEWCWQKLDASLSPKGRFVNILDMEGLTIWDLQSAFSGSCLLCGCDLLWLCVLHAVRPRMGSTGR